MMHGRKKHQTLITELEELSEKIGVKSLFKLPFAWKYSISDFILFFIS
jgi:hypothetical protein